MDKSFKELEDNFKTYSGLTLAQGQIRVSPGGTKNNIRALMQWARDKVRTGNNPAQDVIVAGVNTALLIKRYHTHQAWLSKATEKAKTAKPKQFTDKVKWMDWKDSFENFLRTQAGRNGVPLSYIIRSNDNAIIRANAEFLDDYVNQAYASDTSEVHTYIMNFITENPTAEKKILPYLAQNNGRLVDYNALKDHYEGIGANAKTLVEAEHHVTRMFY